MKINLNTIDRIVFYGCSFTFGTELADHDFIPGFTIDEVDNLKIKMGPTKFYQRYSGTSSIVEMKEKIQLENTRSWAGNFGKIMQKSVINRAKSGSSNTEIIYRLEQDIRNNLINENDLVIIGFTSKERMFYFGTDGLRKSLTFHEQDTRWPDLKIRDYFIKYFVNDFYTMYEHHKNLCHLNHIVNVSKLNILAQFIHSPFFDILSEEVRNDSEFLDIVLQRNNFPFIIDSKLSFSLPELNWRDLSNQHGFTHPKEHLHKQFANLVATSFKEKFLYE